MYIAIDIGGTNVRITSSKSIEQPFLGDSRRFGVRNDYGEVLRLIVQGISDLAGNQPIMGIGCCFAGTLNQSKDTILAAPNISDWVGRPLAQDLKSEFHCKVVMENDAACAALGEAVYGLGKERDFLFLIWGTGVGGAAVTHTASGIQVEPMEPGHSILVWENGRQCGCGQTGCAETYLGGANVEKYLGKTTAALTDEEWTPLQEYMAHTIINALTMQFKPLIVFGGGVAINQWTRLARVEDMVRSRIKIYPAPSIRVTRYGDDAGLLGCLALLAREQEGRSVSTS